MSTRIFITRSISIKILYSVARNGIFSLKWIHDGPTGDILDYWGTLIFWFIIRLKQWIWEYSAGNIVPVKNTIPVITTVLIVQV